MPLANKQENSTQSGQKEKTFTRPAETELVGMFEPGQRQDLIPYIKQLVAMRHYIVADARARITSSYASTLLGNVWLFLTPLLNILVNWLIFGIILSSDTRVGAFDFLSYLVIGRVTFSAFSTNILRSANAMSQTRVLSPEVPRGVIPISQMVRNLYESRFDIALTAAIVLVRGAAIKPTFPLFILVLISAHLIGLGLGFVAARLNSRFTDAASFIGTIMRVLMMVSGIMIPIETMILDRFPNEWIITAFCYLNPAFALVKLSQWAVLGYNLFPLKHAVISATIWPLLALPIGFVIFQRKEATYRDAISR